MSDPTSNHSTSSDYELFVHALLKQELAAVSGLEVVELARDVPMTGLSGYTHQIDVMYRLKIWLTELLVLVECKQYAKRVGVDDLLEFRSRLDDLRAHKGVFVTSSGYQSGALEFARANRISLLIVDATKTLSVMYQLSFPAIEEKCRGQLEQLHDIYKADSSRVRERASIDWLNKQISIQHDGVCVRINPWELRQSMLYKQVCELSDPKREGFSFSHDRFGRVPADKMLKALIVDELLGGSSDA